MTEETKMILDEIRSLKTDVSDMRANMTEMKTDISDLKTEVSALKADMVEVKTEVSALKADMVEVKTEVSALKTDMAEVKADISGMKEEIRNINLVLENDISKRIDIIGEGHDFINRKLDRALLRESHWERIELEIISLRTDTRMIKKHLNIA
ncbi:MAG: hypothetical protein LUD07_00935 [Clostridiales bacterium]|nr:hypothetical protein [Clostridiales bacterium]